MKFRAESSQNSILQQAVNRVFYKHILGINLKNLDGTSRQDIINRCHEGEELVLVPEPDNCHNAGAVKVCCRNGEQIGSLPVNSGRMARELTAGWTFRATIDDIYPFEENPRKHGVRVRLRVLTTGQEVEANRKKELEANQLPHTNKS